jgi:hypothetical protein
VVSLEIVLALHVRQGLTGGVPELYLNMQAGHDLEVARQRLKDELADIGEGPQQHPSVAISPVKGKARSEAPR